MHTVNILQVLPRRALFAPRFTRTDAERLADVLKALADPARLQIVAVLYAAPEHEMAVSHVTAALGTLKQPTVTHHLHILTEVGLLEYRKQGVWTMFKLVPDAIAAVTACLAPPA